MNAVIVIVIVIVMGLNVIFACNVRCKEPMGWAAWFWVSRQNKNDCILKTGQCALCTVRWREGGGSAKKRKILANPPVNC